jgi:hypothetical protein
MLNLDTGLILLVGSRHVMTILRRTPLVMIIPFDLAMPKAHIFLAYICFYASIVHGIFHLIPGIIESSWEAGFLRWTYTVLTGFFIFSVFLIMMWFARASIREHKFELFYAIHLAGAFVFFATLFMHGILFGKLYTWKWILPFVAMYALDRLYRKITERRGYIEVDASRTVSYAQGGVVKLVIPKCMDYQAGQWAELKIPSIGAREWHPFTIASAPSERHIVFFIKQAGDWTKKLGALLIEKKEFAEQATPDTRDEDHHQILCAVRGPYSAPAQQYVSYMRHLSFAVHVVSVCRSNGSANCFLVSFAEFPWRSVGQFDKVRFRDFTPQRHYVTHLYTVLTLAFLNLFNSLRCHRLCSFLEALVVLRSCQL